MDVCLLVGLSSLALRVFLCVILCVCVCVCVCVCRSVCLCVCAYSLVSATLAAPRGVVPRSHDLVVPCRFSSAPRIHHRLSTPSRHALSRSVTPTLPTLPGNTHKKPPMFTGSP